VKGILISLEGIEGTGKTSQVRFLSEYLKKNGMTVTETAEPGGTWISGRIREILLSTDSKGMEPVTELLLYNASRVQHLKEVIIPALQKAEVVITDRFSDSTVAYQGYGRGIDLKLIDDLDKIATNRTRPDLTVLLDLDVETGLRRNRRINKTDRLEQEDVAFHERVRQGFLALAKADPLRIKLVDASGEIEDVRRNILGIVTAFLPPRREPGQAS